MSEMHARQDAPAKEFRFEAADHEYSDERGLIPHITEMLSRTGWVDDVWYSEESSERGTAVHNLTTAFDLGALDTERCVSRYRGYLLGYVKAATALRWAWTEVEIPMAHPTIRFAGRPDRVGMVLKLNTVGEIKSGAFTKAHPIQVALQCILVAGNKGGLPPEAYQRLGIYLTPKGKFKIEEFRDRRDFDEARRILKVCCG